jgi:hypothetical protein
VQVSSTAAITERLPVRPSLKPPRPSPDVSTQRTLPCATASASQAAETSDSLPEKPPMAATSAPSMTCEPAPDWEETAIVPPPWARV